MSTTAAGENSDQRKGKIWKRICIITACLVAAMWALPFVILPAFGVGRIYTIPTSGMEPTFAKGDRVFSNEFAYKFGAPQRGDLAVFSVAGIAGLPSEDPPVMYLKRVAGLPGEKIAIRNGEVFINGQKAAELSRFHHVPMQGSRYLGAESDELTIPQDSYFVLGDNSKNSADSRLWGFVPRASFRGRITTRLWHASEAQAKK